MTGPADITVVGAGVDRWNQLTAEGAAALRVARTVFHARYHGAPPAGLLGPGVTVVDLDAGAYRDGEFRPDMYRRMAERILRTAADVAARPVVVAQPGSAVVVDTVTDLLLDLAPRRGRSVRVVPGVSSIEAVLALLGHDPADGLQVHLAQRLVLHRVRLDPTLATIVLQPGVYDTRWWFGAAGSRPGRFDALVDALVRWLPADAPVAVVVTPFAGSPGAVTWVRLDRLGELPGMPAPMHTLFVPACSPRAVDEAFERRIDDPAAASAWLDPAAGAEQRYEPAPLPAVLRHDAEQLARWWTSGRGRVSPPPR